MAYAIRFSRPAEREFGNLAREIRRRLHPRIQALANDPRPAGAKKLKGRDDLWRIRAGDYRIVYEVRDQILVVLIVRIAHRREVYR